MAHTVYAMWNIESLAGLRIGINYVFMGFMSEDFTVYGEYPILIESDTKIMADKKDRHFQQT